MTEQEQAESSSMEMTRWEKLMRAIDASTKKIRLWLSKVPILGHLAECKTEDHKASFNEVFYNVAFATMPFWLGASLGTVFQSVSTATDQPYGLSMFTDLLVKSIGNGELFVFSTSILAPVMFMILQDPKGSKEFPSKLAVGFLTVLTMIFCAAFFSALKVKPEANRELIFFVSSSLAALSLILRYLATVYHKYRQANPDELKKGEKDFADELMAHR